MNSGKGSLRCLQTVTVCSLGVINRHQYLDAMGLQGLDAISQLLLAPIAGVQAVQVAGHVSVRRDGVCWRWQPHHAESSICKLFRLRGGRWVMKALQVPRKTARNPRLTLPMTSASQKRFRVLFGAFGGSDA